MMHVSERIQFLRDILAPSIGWQVAYAKVEELARESLSVLDEGNTISTGDLADNLWPLGGVHADDMKARKRLFRALAALANHTMADCCGLGAPKWNRMLKREIRPIIWHKPIPKAPGRWSVGENRTLLRDGQPLCTLRPPTGAIVTPASLDALALEFVEKLNG